MFLSNHNNFIVLRCLSKLNFPKVLQSRTHKIYKSKKLNNANFGNFTLNDHQVYLHLISKIGGVDEFGKYLQPERLQREHRLTAKEFSEVFNVSLHNCYGILKQAVDKLMKTDVKIEKPDDSGFWRINVCSMAEYNKNDGFIKGTDHKISCFVDLKNLFHLLTSYQNRSD